MGWLRRDKDTAAAEKTRESKADNTMRRTREIIGSLGILLDELSANVDELNRALALDQKEGD